MSSVLILVIEFPRENWVAKIGGADPADICVPGFHPSKR